MIYQAQTPGLCTVRQAAIWTDSDKWYGLVTGYGYDPSQEAPRVIGLCLASDMSHRKKPRASGVLSNYTGQLHQLITETGWNRVAGQHKCLGTSPTTTRVAGQHKCLGTSPTTTRVAGQHKCLGTSTTTRVAGQHKCWVTFTTTTRVVGNTSAESLLLLPLEWLDLVIPAMPSVR